MNRLKGVVLGTVLAAACGSALAQAPAVWREHEFSFTYMGFTTRYSCDGLRHKVTSILALLGARDKPEVRASGCEIGGGVALAPRVHVRVALPEPAAPDARGAFDADRATVTLAPRRPGNLAAGDCELVEQLRERVFPQLGVDVVAERTGCVPHQLGIGRPLVKLDVLRAAGAD